MEYETYYESAEGMMITQKRALKEVTNHGSSIDEFLTDMGNHSTYNAQAVLDWLGY